MTECVATEFEAIHGYFGLSYATHLAMPRTLLQSMPDEWQAQFVALLREYDDAFDHVEQVDYEVRACRWVTVKDTTADESRQLGLTDSYDHLPPEPGDDATPEQVDEYEMAERLATDNFAYYDRHGNEVDDTSRFPIPVADPVPHYNRGRTRVEPRLPADQ